MLKKLLIHLGRFSPLEYYRVAFVHGHGGVLLKHSRPSPSSPCEEVQEMLLAEGAGPRRRVNPIGAVLDETRLFAHGKPSLLMTREISAKLCQSRLPQCNDLTAYYCQGSTEALA